MDYLFLASFSEIASYVGYIALAILILLIMITVHEFGHYITGKIFGFGIDEFAIGFGPKLFSRTRKSGEIFSIRLLPIGGFCAFRGEDQESDDPSAFNNRVWWQRVIVLISGALMNYILALIVIIIMFSAYGQTSLVAYKMAYTDQIESTYCFEKNDIIISANGKNVYMLTDLMNAIDKKEQGELVDFIVRRNGVDTPIKIKLRCDANFTNLEDNKTLYTALGFYFEEQDGVMTNGGLFRDYVKFGFFETIGRSVEYSFMLGGMIFKILGQLITGALGLNTLGGTLTTITVTADAIRLGGFNYFLNMLSLIGVNLAVFNLLPFPALDGSRVVFTLIEGIRKKPINRRVEGIIHAVGLFVLLLFAVIVDLQHCF